MIAITIIEINNGTPGLNTHLNIYRMIEYIKIRIIFILFIVQFLMPIRGKDFEFLGHNYKVILVLFV